MAVEATKKNFGGDDPKQNRNLSVSQSQVYNTITNPVPWVNHNPYISNEKKILGVEGPIENKSGRQIGRSPLSQVAEQHLI